MGCPVNKTIYKDLIPWYLGSNEEGLEKSKNLKRG